MAKTRRCPHLGWAAPRHQVHIPHSRLPELAQGAVRHVGAGQPLLRRQQQPRAVQCHIAHAQHRDAAHGGQVDAHIATVRVAIVPPHEPAGRQHARRTLPPRSHQHAGAAPAVRYGSHNSSLQLTAD
jgi:hypothetical protein